MKKVCFTMMTVVVIISSCSSIPLAPQAKRVIVSPNKPSKKCKYLSQVVGNQGNFFTGAWTPNKNLEEGAMNDLKNQASKKGANYVQLVTNRAGTTGSFNSLLDNYNGSIQQTNVTNLGNAYTCPAATIGL